MTMIYDYGYGELYLARIRLGYPFSYPSLHWEKTDFLIPVLSHKTGIRKRMADANLWGADPKQCYH